MSHSTDYLGPREIAAQWEGECLNRDCSNPYCPEHFGFVDAWDGQIATQVLLFLNGTKIGELRAVHPDLKATDSRLALKWKLEADVSAQVSKGDQIAVQYFIGPDVNYETWRE